MFCSVECNEDGYPVSGSYVEHELWVSKSDDIDVDCTELKVGDNVHKLNITVRIANLFDMDGNNYT